MNSTWTPLLAILLTLAVGCGESQKRLKISDRSGNNSTDKQSKLLNGVDLTTACKIDGSEDKSDDKQIFDFEKLRSKIQSPGLADTIGRSYISSIQIFNSTEYAAGKYVDIKDQQLMRSYLEQITFEFAENRLSKLIDELNISQAGCESVSHADSTGVYTHSIDVSNSDDRVLQFTGAGNTANKIQVLEDTKFSLTTEKLLQIAQPCGELISVVARVNRVLEFGESIDSKVSLRKEIFDVMASMTQFPIILDENSKAPEASERNPNTVQLDMEVFRLFDFSIRNKATESDNILGIIPLKCEQPTSVEVESNTPTSDPGQVGPR